MGIDIRLGGTPTRGLAIGVQIFSNTARESDVFLPSDDAPATDDSSPPAADRSNVTASSSLLGFFVDYYPNARDNFHFGGSVGLATNVIEHDGAADPELDEAGGLGASVWAGYGWWVSTNWSLGFLGQITATMGETSSAAMQARSGSVVGMLSATYH